VSLFGLFLTFALAAERPFWTEKSSYTEGDRVYFVGIATNSKTVEEGRQRALEHAQQELSNYFQLTDVTFLTFETQMTFEEPNKDGTFNTFRLMFIEKAAVVKIKNKKLELAKKTEDLNSELESIKKITAEWETASTGFKDKKAYVRRGMPEEQVKKIMGKPTRTKSLYLGGTCLFYNDVGLYINDGVLRDSDTYCNPF
jgi:hypothetical protein